LDLNLLVAKEQRLKETIRCLDRVMIAYSGGVDSSLLAHYGRKLLGQNATIVIAVSPSLANEELAFARAQGKQFAWDVVEIETDEVEKPEYQRNDAMRCYFCKSTLFETMQKLSLEKGIRNLAYGANLDDLSDFRPGQLAAQQYQVLSPLQDADLSKDEIRHLARAAGLPSWDRPQAACLSSRFPTSIPIDISKLSQVDKAEALLRAYGFRQVRVRHHDKLARIEVDPAEMQMFADRELLTTIVADLKRLGYTYITVDLEGYRQGSSNFANSAPHATQKRN
jgi:uncharacterized protein